MARDETPSSVSTGAKPHSPTAATTATDANMPCLLVLAIPSFRHNAHPLPLFSDGEVLKLTASAAAAVEDVRITIEVWNENAPMPDTLISQSSIHISDLIKVPKYIKL